MTAAEFLARAHAVTDGATSGPWGYYESTGHITDRERGLSIAPIGDLRGDSRTRIEDVRFAAHARTLLPAAMAAIEAALALHVSSAETRGVGQVRNGVWTAYCEGCGDDHPCPTVRAITAHLDPS